MLSTHHDPALQPGRRASVRALLAVVVLVLTGCATTDRSVQALPVQAAGETSPSDELRLGYFANLTHATPLVGVREGTYQQALGATALRTQVFNAGPAAIEALFAGALDAAYVGPNPAINAFAKSGGRAIRIVAGATSGGAALVVQPSITGVQQLRGARLASPQTGGTQDIALRHYLAVQGFSLDERGAGDVTIVAQENAQTLRLFQSGDLDGAWVPEPWASRLVLEAGGRVLVDEASLWPGGRFTTTHLVVRTEFLARHPETVSALLRGQVATGRLIRRDGPRARQVLNAEIERLTGTRLTPATLNRAFERIEVTEDPVASSLKTSARHAFATGLVDEVDLTGIYDLRLLDRVLGTTTDAAGLVAPSPYGRAS